MQDIQQVHHILIGTTAIMEGICRSCSQRQLECLYHVVILMIANEEACQHGITAANGIMYLAGHRTVTIDFAGFRYQDGTVRTERHQSVRPCPVNSLHIG